MLHWMVCPFPVVHSCKMQRYPECLKGVVYVRQMSCEEPIEKLYYSAKFADICVYCSASVAPWNDRQPHYPQCNGCATKPPIPNAKKSKS